MSGLARDANQFQRQPIIDFDDRSALIDEAIDGTSSLVGVGDREGVLRVSVGRAVQVRPGDETARLRQF